MYKVIFSLAAVLLSATVSAQEWTPSVWPVLKHYDAQHLYQIALPLGGIGTGTVSLGGRGELRDWEIMNVPGKKYSTVTTGNNAPFFAIYTKPQQGAATTTLLAGPLYTQEYLHYEGRPVNNHGMPRFAEASLMRLILSDKCICRTHSCRCGYGKGFNPLIPGNSDDSGLPVAVLTYEVTNTTDQPLDVAICGSIRNLYRKRRKQIFYQLEWRLYSYRSQS